VGKDRVKHLDLARELARRFNARYGETFPEPKALLSPAKRIIGLDGVHKMSKSRGNEIGLLDPPDVVRKKLAPAKTDEKRKRRQDPGEPNDCNVYSLHRHVTPPEKWPYIETGCRTAAIGCLDCKGILAESIEAIARPIRERAAALDADPGSVDRVLEEGAERAGAIARDTLREVQQKVGLR
jgi:tryptophanyl-tRNA synthetase